MDNIEKKVKCGRCHGSGKIEMWCGNCYGTGKVGGIVFSRLTCSKCAGEGVCLEECPVCHGEKTIALYKPGTQPVCVETKNQGV